jgi:eukaryotic-like serine/threonine-protein kinase
VTDSALAETERERSQQRSGAASGSRPSGVRLGSLPVDSDDDLRFIQKRLALFAKTTFLISSMFLVVTTLADAASPSDRYSVLSRVSHVTGTLIALSGWRLAARRRDLSPNMLQMIDIAATLGACWTFAAMGHFAVQPYGSYTGLLAVTHVSISRAMIVPSVPGRTLWISVGCFLSLVLSRATCMLPPDMVGAAGARSRAVLEAVLWSTAGVAVSTVASKVIYGLHARAREAQKLGQYTLEEKIGEGGMGEVYRARHAMLRRPTAVKLLSGDGTSAQVRRFEKEVQLTARLTHPNTISIYDYGRTPDGIFYYAMELLDGLTLEQLVQRHGPQPARRTIHFLLQICGALREAHGVGLIHRDIKPANIFVCRRGDVPDVVKVLDFGLVREVAAERDLTQSNVNAVVGTPLYLSPEAILTPDHVDARADIYGLGAVAYFLLSGVTPFTGKSAVELCAHHLHTPPPPLSNRLPIPNDLERVVLTCLAKKPEQRPESALALGQALERCRDAHSWSERDAEAWWRGVQAEEPRPAARSSEEAPQRTVVRVDLGERLGDEKTA